MSTLTIVFLVLAVLGALGGVVLIWQAIRHVIRRRPEPPATKSDVERILEEIARVTVSPGTPPPDTAKLAAEATESIERQLEEALELFHAGEYREAIDGVLTAYSQELPPTAKTELDLVAGNAFYSLSDYGAAEAHYREAMTIARASGDRQNEADAAGNLGRALLGAEKPKEASDYFEQALERWTQLDDIRQQARRNLAVGECWFLIGERMKAGNYFREAVRLYGTFGGDSFGRSMARRRLRETEVG